MHIKMQTTMRIVPQQAQPKTYVARRWGDEVLVRQAGLTVANVGSNFQPLQLLPVRETDAGEYIDNSGTYSAIVNSVKLTHDDVMRVEAMQPNDGVGIKQKMQWWCYPGAGTRPAWCKSPKNSAGEYIYDYSNSPVVYWGTIAIGGRPIQIDSIKTIVVKLSAEPKERPVRMGRVVCFRKSQWGVDPSAHPHIIQEQAGAGNDNVYIGYPKGTIRAPLFDPRDWEFTGKYQPTAYYIPMDWLIEERSEQ